ncbi:uncharacterized protein N7473_013237 [Penicillium subrubescens]|uniref:uncharacterized protein n=1 Tax=Penicillium subrubescens TaxID=1316194 RepID=UPI0025459C55|nr:uncharacterized protein N7473_013237 [Penicillium subrubescens]KAJ5873678.1 hypothetical protein N7473_013237 [Penicillium subrubescens]
MLETPRAGLPRTPSSSRHARCEPADEDSVPSQTPQQQPSPPYPHESIHDQSMDDGLPLNPSQSMQGMQNIPNGFYHFVEYPSASQQSDLMVADLEQGFYQAVAQYFYDRFLQHASGVGRANISYLFTAMLHHQFPHPSPVRSDNHFMPNQERN